MSTSNMHYHPDAALPRYELPRTVGLLPDAGAAGQVAARCSLLLCPLPSSLPPLPGRGDAAPSTPPGPPPQSGAPLHPNPTANPNSTQTPTPREPNSTQTPSPAQTASLRQLPPPSIPHSTHPQPGSRQTRLRYLAAGGAAAQGAAGAAHGSPEALRRGARGAPSSPDGRAAASAERRHRRGRDGSGRDEPPQLGRQKGGGGK